MLATIFAPSPEGGAAGSSLFILVAFIAIFYFLLIRPQRKQQKAHDEMVRNLRRGDLVVTLGGIMGKIVHMDDEKVTIKTGDTRVEVERAKIGRLLNRPES